MTLALIVLLLAQAPETRTVKVQVLVGEKPAPAEIEVRLLNGGPLCGTAQFNSAPMKHPDAQGWVTFDGAEAGAAINAQSPAYGSAGTGTDGAGPFTIRFPAGLPLRGRLLDAKGRPVLIGRVTVISAEGEHAVRHQAVNEKDGTFFFANLAKGKWAVLADEFDNLWSQGIEVNAGDEKVEAKVFPSRVTVSGSVSDTNGNPVPKPRLLVRTMQLGELGGDIERPKSQAQYDALLTPRPEPKYFMTWIRGGDDGHFEAGLPTSQPMEVRADAPKRCAQGIWLPLIPSEPAALRIPAPAKVKVKVLGANGAPLPKVKLSMELPEMMSTVDCDLEQDVELEPVDGAIARDVPVVIPSITLRAAGHQPVTKQLKVKAGKELDLGTVKFALGARVVGKVTGVDGKPAGFVPIYLGDEYLVNAEEDGTFAADGLKPGKAVLEAGSDGDAKSVKQTVKLTAGAETTVQFKLVAKKLK